MLSKSTLAQLMQYKLQAVGLSDIGLLRQNNEDVCALSTKYRFFILADGMGGHLAGEVAAREAVDTLQAEIEQKIPAAQETISHEELSNRIIEAIENVNVHIYDMGRQDRELRGMGTTLCCLYFHLNEVVYAHVGDSRIYRLRDKKLQQLTKDHSLLRELVDFGQMDERHSGGFAYKNIITKAIGTESSVEPSVFIDGLLDHDLYLMCTDGLSDLVTREEMEQLMNKRSSLTHLAHELVEAAKERGGHDNITVVLVRVTEKHETKDLSR